MVHLQKGTELYLAAFLVQDGESKCFLPFSGGVAQLMHKQGLGAGRAVRALHALLCMCANCAILGSGVRSLDSCNAYGTSRGNQSLK